MPSDDRTEAPALAAAAAATAIGKTHFTLTPVPPRGTPGST